MVFRREGRNDAFQRQISELRRQLGTPPAAGDEPDAAAYEQPDDAFGGEPYDEEVVAERPAVRRTIPQRDVPDYGYASYSMKTPPETSFSLTGFDEPIEPTIPDLPFLGDTDTSVIAEDTVFRGEMASNGSVHIQGRAEGTIIAREGIYVADEAEVDATLAARTIIISGTVTGTIQAAERLEILPEGHASGSIVSPTLVVHNGAHLDGTVRMTLTDEEQRGIASPTIEAARSRHHRTGSSRR